MNQRILIIWIGIFLLSITGAVIYQFDRQNGQSSKELVFPKNEQLFKKDSTSEQSAVSSEKPTDNSKQLAVNSQQIINTTPMETQKEEQQPVNSEQSTMDKKEGETKTKKYTATLHTTKGDIVIALNDKGTPNTVANFVTLSKKNFYNGTVFHRVIKGFMIQGGDPFCNPGKDESLCGTGGPGYKFDDEPFEGDYSRGMIAMANSGPNTNGSQFFIMHADYALPKNYIIFGHVIKGIEIVDIIASAQMTRGNDGAASKPLEPVQIKSVEIQQQ